MAAAETETDGDSLFNAGFCLENGIGVKKDSAAAAVLYTKASKQFGHFAAIKAMGSMYFLVRLRLS